MIDKETLLYLYRAALNQKDLYGGTPDAEIPVNVDILIELVKELEYWRLQGGINDS